MKKHFILSVLFTLSTLSSASAEVLKPLPQFDWSTVINVPPVPEQNVGNQVLHFKMTNKPYTLNKSAVDFVNTNLSVAKQLSSDAEVIRFGSDAVTLQDGAYIEVGTGVGRTTNFIAALNPIKTISSFDSFDGLPIDWDRPDVKISVGTFAYKDKNFFPPVLANVNIYKGLFADVLPIFQQEMLKSTPIAFLHVDSDIYESARDTFVALKNNIVPGTIIVFDEFYNYENCENHEMKALQEFLKSSGYKAEYLAYNSNHEQIAIRIVK